MGYISTDFSGTLAECEAHTAAVERSFHPAGYATHVTRLVEHFDDGDVSWQFSSAHQPNWRRLDPSSRYTVTIGRYDSCD